MTIQYNASINNARADATFTPRNSGSRRLYTGVKPTHPVDALSGNTLIVTGTFGATAFPAASGTYGGSSTSNAVTGANAVASGTPTFYRDYASDGTTCVSQGDVGTDITVTPSAVVSGAPVNWGTVAHTEATT
jgi:hypothetical protein